MPILINIQYLFEKWTIHTVLIWKITPCYSCLIYSAFTTCWSTQPLQLADLLSIYNLLIYSAFTTCWSTQHLQLADLLSIYSLLIYLAFTSRWSVCLTLSKSPCSRVCFNSWCVVQVKNALFCLASLLLQCGFATDSRQSNTEPQPKKHRTTAEKTPNHSRKNTEPQPKIEAGGGPPTHPKWTQLTQHY